MAKRRGNNEGSIYKRKDGRWCAQVSIHGKRKYKYGKTQRECRLWIKEIQNQVDGGLTFNTTKLTVGEYLKKWLVEIKPNIREKTWIQYKQTIHNHLLPTLGSIRLWDVKPDLIQRFYSQKIDAGIGLHTLRMVHAVLHAALARAVKWSYITRNPAAVVDKPKVPRKEMSTLDSLEVNQLLHVAHDSRYEALYYLAVTTGMRQGELLGLQWPDLDWSTSTLAIQRQLQRISGKGLVFTEPKSKTSKRNVILGSYVITKLEQRLQALQTERLFAGDRWTELDLIFSTSIGTPVDPRSLLRDFHGILSRAGLPRIRFHDLRHTAASLMLQEGIHVKVVQERLGHSSITLTLDTYSHVLPGLQQEAAQRLDDLIVGIPVELFG